MKPASIKWGYSKGQIAYGGDATLAEKGLVWGAMLGAPLLLWMLGAFPHDWVWWQWLIAVVTSADACGGAVANSLNAAKRYFHSPPAAADGKAGALLKRHTLFVALHGHTAVVALAFGGSLLGYGMAVWGALICATLIVQRTPLYLERPVAVLLCLMAILCNIYLLSPPDGFAWLVPVLFLKLVLFHSVKEEPYART